MTGQQKSINENNIEISEELNRFYMRKNEIAKDNEVLNQYLTELIYLIEQTYFTQSLNPISYYTHHINFLNPISVFDLMEQNERLSNGTLKFNDEIRYWFGSGPCFGAGDYIGSNNKVKDEIRELDIPSFYNTDWIALLDSLLYKKTNRLIDDFVYVYNELFIQFIAKFPKTLETIKNIYPEINWIPLEQRLRFIELEFKKEEGLITETEYLNELKNIENMF